MRATKNKSVYRYFFKDVVLFNNHMGVYNINFLLYVEIPQTYFKA